MQRSFIRAFIVQLCRALFSPAPRNTPVQPLRSFVALPVVFDLVSLAMQAIDYRRTQRIVKSYGVDDPHHRAVQDYNAGVTVAKTFTSTRRMDVLYKLLAFPPRALSAERILIVGPRNRHELIAAWVHGFAWRNIDAIDLFSTHPKIRVMNMEAMTWPGETFDAVTMAYTLSYAEDTGKAIGEVARVLRSGGRFAFSVSYVPDGKRWKESTVTAGEIAHMLHGSGFEIEFHQAGGKITSDGFRQASHLFVARKIPPDEQRLDPFRL